MQKLSLMLNLNSLTCAQTCWGPGADLVSLHARVYDLTDQTRPPILIPGASADVGPFEMDSKPGAGAVATVGPRNLFRNVEYVRPGGALPDNIAVTMLLLKGGARVQFDVPLELSIHNIKLSTSIPLGRPIAKLVDLFESDVIGSSTDNVDNQLASNTSTGQKFTQTFTGIGSSYVLTYSLIAAVAP